MPDDFDNFGEFDWDPDEDDNEEAHHELDEKQRRIRNLPLMKKAAEIYRLTQAIAETIEAEKDVLNLRAQMLANAATLMPKIAVAEGSDFYTTRMENAVIIKIHARELLAQTTLCKAEGLTESHYLRVLREEIDAFRQLFVEWVKGFDRTHDLPDNWGLFEQG